MRFQQVYGLLPTPANVFGALCAMAMSSTTKSQRWRGRPFDLVGADRQCAVWPTSKSYAHIVVQHPVSHQFCFLDEGTAYWSCAIGPFVSACGIFWSQVLGPSAICFDDYVVLAMEEETGAVAACIHMFFKLVGWDFAVTGTKAPAFSEMFEALGVVFNIGALYEGLVTVGSTESRHSELLQALMAILEKRKLSCYETLEVDFFSSDAIWLSPGRSTRSIAWSEELWDAWSWGAAFNLLLATFFGGVARSVLAVVTQHAYSGHASRLDDKALLALKLHVKLFELSRPRELCPSSNAAWYIQTDASFASSDDPTFAGIGAVLFEPSQKPVKFFSKALPTSMIYALNPAGKKPVIYECEFFALFCAFLVWGRDLSGAGDLHWQQRCQRCFDCWPYSKHLGEENFHCYAWFGDWASVDTVVCMGRNRFEFGRWAISFEVGAGLTTWCQWLVLVRLTLCSVGMRCWPMLESGEKIRPQLHPIIAKRRKRVGFSLSTYCLCSHSDQLVSMHSPCLHPALGQQRFQNP